ncbi:unnamed protein product [Blepharisma stoltei]|uniref:Uncharacterized protein n=1 Tax=Blepharisma stoltei TaxID=1481888 RepID=A0AAU9ITX6_9CILI|nr:unnamed protein product [Blepharisma stoltei]
MVEDEIHLLDECYLYDSYRVELLIDLEKCGVLYEVIGEKFKVHEIALYSQRFVEWFEEKHKEKFEEVDGKIKKFIYSVMKCRERNAEFQR